MLQKSWEPGPAVAPTWPRSLHAAAEDWGPGKMELSNINRTEDMTRHWPLANLQVGSVNWARKKWISNNRHFVQIITMMDISGI